MAVVRGLNEALPGTACAGSSEVQHAVRCARFCFTQLAGCKGPGGSRSGGVPPALLESSVQPGKPTAVNAGQTRAATDGDAGSMAEPASARMSFLLQPELVHELGKTHVVVGDQLGEILRRQIGGHEPDGLACILERL